MRKSAYVAADFCWLRRVTCRLVSEHSRPLSREQREFIRGQIDQARRRAAKQGAGRDGQDAPVDAVAAVLAANPERRFSCAEIARTLEFSDDRARRALLALQTQGRAATVLVGKLSRWKAVETGPA